MQKTPRETFGLSITGDVLEIGPGLNPIAVSRGANVRYADRSVVGGRDANWPELSGQPAGVQAQYDLDLDQEGLSQIASASLDAVIAAHVIEHVANPLKVLTEFSRVLRPGGKILLIVPDRALTFDAPRKPTPFSLLAKKFAENVTAVDDETIKEFCEVIYSQPSIHPPLVREWHNPGKLDLELYALHRRRSIHAHCWSPEDFASLVAAGLLLGLWNWRFEGAYFADHFPARQANEFGLMLQLAAEDNPELACRHFVRDWSSAVLNDSASDSERIVGFHDALIRDLSDFHALDVARMPLACLTQHVSALSLALNEQRLGSSFAEQQAREITATAQRYAECLQAQSEDLATRLKAAHLRIAALEASTSWKITGPLRAFARLIRQH